MAKQTPKNITQERAARRFHQIAVLERQRTNIAADIATAKAHVKELEKAHDGLLARMQTASRDEGELPLFDLDEDD
jgi:hypothetical protein